MPSEQEPISAARPRATSFVLGIVLIAIIGAAISSLFLFTHSVGLFASALIAIAVGLAGLFSLAWGNIERARLIYDFSASAAEKRAYLEKNVADPAERDRILSELHDYEAALSEVSAYKEASQISRTIADVGGLPPSESPSARSAGRESPPAPKTGGKRSSDPDAGHEFPFDPNAGGESPSGPGVG